MTGREEANSRLLADLDRRLARLEKRLQAIEDAARERDDYELEQLERNEPALGDTEEEAQEKLQRRRELGAR